MRIVRTPTTTRTTTELVNRNGPREKTNDLQSVLQARVVQERVPREADRTEEDEKVLTHCNKQ